MRHFFCIPIPSVLLMKFRRRCYIAANGRGLAMWWQFRNLACPDTTKIMIPAFILELFPNGQPRIQHQLSVLLRAQGP